jgi:hypothetical protein
LCLLGFVHRLARQNPVLMAVLDKGRGHLSFWLLRFHGRGTSFSGPCGPLLGPKSGLWHVWSASGPRQVRSGSVERVRFREPMAFAIHHSIGVPRTSLPELREWCEMVHQMTARLAANAADTQGEPRGGAA